jgi:hypothetical protein
MKEKKSRKYNKIKMVIDIDDEIRVRGTQING